MLESSLLQNPTKSKNKQVTLQISWAKLALIQNLNFVPFLYSTFLCIMLRVTFCVIITVSRIKGSTVFSKLELHVLRLEIPA